MVSLTSLWMPILLSAALVFVVSSIIHMFLTYHQNDFTQVPDEDKVMDALRPFAIPAGDYVIPYAGGAENMRSEAFREKVEKGPVLFMTMMEPGGLFDMRASLTLWFLYSVVVGALAAYLAGWLLAPGAPYMDVFRLTGTVAFVAYAMALPQRSIWYKQKWSSTMKSMFDGLLYALVTAGIFGWLWPA